MNSHSHHSTISFNMRGCRGLQPFWATCALMASSFNFTLSLSSPAKLDLKTREKDQEWHHWIFKE